MAPCACFGGLLRGGRTTAPTPAAANVAVVGSEAFAFPDEAAKNSLLRLVRDEISGHLDCIQKTFVQELRQVEVQISQQTGSERGSSVRRRYQKDVELLHKQILQLEHVKRHRHSELGKLRQALLVHRKDAISSMQSDASREVAENELLADMRSERECWESERCDLEERIHSIEAELKEPLPSAPDPERDRLQRSVKQLQMSIDSRDRYACWVCNQQAQEGQQDDSDSGLEMTPVRSDASTSSAGPSSLGDEVASMKHEISRMKRELKQLRSLTSTPSSSQSVTPRLFARRRSTSTSRHSADSSDVDMRPESARAKSNVNRQSSTASSSSPVATKRPPGGHVGFSGQVSAEAPQALADGTQMGTRSIRDRIATPFILPDSVVEDKDSADRAEEEGGVSFSEAVSTAPAPEMSDDELPVGRRSSRDRVSTPFAPSDPEGLVHFHMHVDLDEVETEGAPRRSVRGRVPTGFARDELAEAEVAAAAPCQAVGGGEAGSGVRFAPYKSDGRAASSVQPGGARSVRGRTPTGFVHKEAVEEPEEGHTICFRRRVSVAEIAGRKLLSSSEAAAAAAAAGIEAEVEVDGDDDDGVRFSEEVVEAEAAGEVNAGAVRSIRGRTPTGFVRSEDALGASASASPSASASASAAAGLRLPICAVGNDIRFAEEVSVAEAASSPPAPGATRSVRGRTPTGFVSAEAAREAGRAAEPSIRFKEDATDIGEAASASETGSGVRRSVRGRTPTGFVTADAAALADDRDEREILAPNAQTATAVTAPRAVTSSSSSSSQSYSNRVSNSNRNSHGNSKDDGGSKASVRGHPSQTQTQTHSRNPAQQQLRFAAEADTEEAASAAASPGKVRSVRGRTPTGFVTAEALPNEEQESRETQRPSPGLRFAEEATVMEADAASSSTVTAPGKLRSARGRTPTGFVTKEALDEHTSAQEAQAQAQAPAAGPPTGTRGGGVRFAETPSVSASASSESAGSQPLRSVRGRTPTGFVTAEALPEDAEANTNTNTNAIPSASASASASAPPSASASASAGVRFVEAAAAVAEAASEAPVGGGRSVRGRTPTGFVTKEALLQRGEGEGSEGVRFQEGRVVVADAASTTPAGAVRSVKGRTPTGFVAADLLAAGGSDSAGASPTSGEAPDRGVRFEEATVVVGDAASEVTAGAVRSVRGRTPTGFVREEALGAESPQASAGSSAGEQGGADRGVRFAESATVAEAATEVAGGQLRSVRGRTPTGFVTAEAVPEESPQARSQAQETPCPNGAVGVRFNPEVAQGDAAGSPSSSGTLRSVRGRTPTGFVSGDAAAAIGQTGSRVLFSNDVSVEAVPNAVPPGGGRPVRGRTPTGFVHDDEATEVEQPAAGLGVAGADSQEEHRNGISFAPSDETFEQAVGEESGFPAAVLKSVRDRQPTAWVSNNMIPSPTGEDRCVRFTEGAHEPTTRTAHSTDKRLASHTTTASAWTDTSSNKSLADSTSSNSTARAPNSSGGERAGHTESDDETMSSCSSRRERSRLSTPHISPSILSFPVPAAAESAEGRQQAPRKPRSRNTSTASEAERYSLKQVSIESNVEREINERVRRVSKQTQDCDERLLRGKMAALGPVTRGCLTPLASQLPVEGFGMPDYDQIDQGLPGRRVPGAVKDSALLRNTLRKLAFFEDFDDAAMHCLIDAMAVYEFDDGEVVVRQGDADGTYFFVVASGEFVELRDGHPYCVIGPGCCFGESVLVLFGERGASVRAKGRARAYAMEGMAVREILRDQFEQKRTTVIEAVDEMLRSETCVAFSQLNAYQLQTLYDEVFMRSYKEGEVILTEGTKEQSEVLVLTAGTVTSMAHGSPTGDLERFAVMGDRAVLYQEQHTTLVAGPGVEVLVLKVSLLTTIFGDELAKVLLRNRIMAVLMQHDVFGRLHEEQREAVYHKCEVRQLAPLEELQDEQLRFVVCLHGEVETIVPQESGGAKEKLKLARAGSHQWSTFGDDNLLTKERPSAIHVRATGGTPSVTLAVWHGSDLDNVLAFHMFESALEEEDKVRVLKTLFLFQTLSKQQLARLANALQVRLVDSDEVVFRQGEIGTHLFIIRRGSVLIEINGNKIRTLGAGDYFGERALLSSEVRTATVTGTEYCELWMMDKPTFQEVMQGPCLEYLTTRIALQDTRLSMEDLEFERIIGRGGFGVVKLVKCVRTGLRYALKCVRKRNVVEKSLQEAIVSERSILAEVDHPFIVKFVRSFKNNFWVYFLMEVVTGGELLDALETLGLLTHDQAQFYTGTLVLALEFLHARRIAYLDLKSENCLVDHQGYLKIIDFGIAQRIVGNRNHTVMGTPIFMAPEIVLGKGYTTVADLWSLGICLYEFLIGDFPFGNTSMNHGDIFHEVLRGQLCFPAWFEKKPQAEMAMSLIRGLLTREPAQRLGAAFDGYESLKKHVFFQGLDWDHLLGREVRPPYIPHCETYAEDKEGRNSEEGAGTNMAEMEVSDPTDANWTDPNPGWDADF